MYRRCVSLCVCVQEKMLFREKHEQLRVRRPEPASDLEVAMLKEIEV